MSATREDLTLDWPAGLDFEAWAERMRGLLVRAESSPWHLGDGWLLAERLFARGEDGSEDPQVVAAIRMVLADATTFDPRYLSACYFTAERFPPEVRWPSLSWSHHEVVSHLSDDEALELLGAAEAGGWTREELRREVGRRRRVAGTSRARRAEVVVRVRSAPEYRGVLERGAEAAARGLRVWLVGEGVEAEVVVR